MGVEERLAVLGARLQRDMQAEFPAWQISREESGQWVAVRPGWGVMHARSAAELRVELRRSFQRHRGSR